MTYRGYGRFTLGTLLAGVAFLFCFFSSPVPVTNAAATGDAAAKSMAKRLALPALDKCGMISQFSDSKINSPLSPTATLCINGALAISDPNYNRVLMSSTGTGVGTGVVGNCSLSGSGTAVEYDNYSFNLTGCAAFPTVVTMQLCGPAGCVAPAALDTTITLYRNVAAGDPLTANGGLPGVFNPASACTNARAANDDSGATPTSTGGSTCNQLNTADCLPQCAAPASTANSEMKRSLGNGRFTLVIAGFGNGTTGSYNLYVNVPAAGCSIALAPSAANGSLAGRVLTSEGRAIRNAIVSLTDSGGVTRTAVSNTFGNYRFDGLESGTVYVIGATAKGHQFTSQFVNVNDDVTSLDLTAEPGE